MATNIIVAERRLVYLARAADARTAAHEAQDWEARETFGKIADSWELMADQVLRTDKM